MVSRQVPKVTVPYRYNPYQSSVLGRRTVICVAKDRISKWALILKGLNWLSISDFWSAWINKAVDSISIIVASWQKDKASVVMSPESNIYDLFFVHKIPSGQLSRIYIQKSTEPGQTPSKTILNREKLWIFEVFDRRQNPDFRWFLPSHVIRILKEGPIVEAFVHLQNTLRETLSET